MREVIRTKASLRAGFSFFRMNYETAKAKKESTGTTLYDCGVLLAIIRTRESLVSLPTNESSNRIAEHFGRGAGET
ncbi:MAG TPA: hypothetical protein VNO32_05805, partial [Candidatus Acidoferrum sp.]|nr:hypothetical protein [Candidatus Acidoferrum sp.]